MLILALDCSTSRGSLAVGWNDSANGDGLLLERLFPAGRGHGGELFSTLDAALQEAAASVGISQQPIPLARIVVGLGPGSYSGVRQSIALAIGLSLATGASILGVPSIFALEEIDPAISCHVIGDARRGTYYYSAVLNNCSLRGPELLENADVLLERLAIHPAWQVLAAETLPPSLPGGVVATVSLPQAARLLAVPHEPWQTGALEPIYLRPPSITPPRAAA